jgi:hypothetical protein
MDNITKNVVLELVKSGHCTDLICHELDLSLSDVQKALHEATFHDNILAEQLATRLPTLLELSFKQLQSIILNDSSDRKLKAIQLLLNSATTLAKLNPKS